MAAAHQGDAANGPGAFVCNAVQEPLVERVLRSLDFDGATRQEIAQALDPLFRGVHPSKPSQAVTRRAAADSCGAGHLEQFAGEGGGLDPLAAIEEQPGGSGQGLPARLRVTVRGCDGENLIDPPRNLRTLPTRRATSRYSRSYRVRPSAGRRAKKRWPQLASMYRPSRKTSVLCGSFKTG